MYYKFVFRFIKVAVCSFTMLACSDLPKYDLVIENANYLSLESGEFIKMNLGIDDGKIVEISSKTLQGDERIDAGGQFIYPGFIDAHCHFYGYAQGLLAVNLVGTKSIEDVVSRVVDFERENPGLDFIVGRGWDQNDWEDKQFPSNKLLNERFPEKMIVLERIDGHASLVNEKVIRQIINLPEVIDGGQIVKKDGKLTGLFIDAAQRLIPSQKNSPIEMVRALQLAESNCYAHGLTGLADAGLPESTIRFLDSLQERGVLSIPLYVMLSDNTFEINSLFKQGLFDGKRLKSRSIKVYSDGALGSRGALLLKPYADSPEHFGLELKNKEDLRALCQIAKSKGLQVNVHAIGDSANRMVLQVFAEILQGKNDLRWRIEHAQIVNPIDSVYFKDFSILPSVQPTHATSDMYWAEDRLGAGRIQHAYSCQSMHRWSGGHMPLGTDFPVEDIDPRKTIYAAVTRQDSLKFPEGGFIPNQKLTRLQALRGMTIEAAFAQFEENEKGSIEVGKWADLVLSPVNLLECSEKDILNAPISATLVRGKVVFEASK